MRSAVVRASGWRPTPYATRRHRGTRGLCRWDNSLVQRSVRPGYHKTVNAGARRQPHLLRLHSVLLFEDDVTMERVLWINLRAALSRSGGRRLRPAADHKQRTTGAGRLRHQRTAGSE
ncbi:hypothetical protein PG991_008191 [Apiospora marii]|uniref:Uncharacterized protein n=1 Tax=Apiospora marii TaxID=335849 RepID=A0ABR1RVL3_9PEZI